MTAPMKGTALSVALGNEARLDGAKLGALVQESRGLHRLTPDLKLAVKLDPTLKDKELASLLDRGKPSSRLSGRQDAAGVQRHFVWPPTLDVAPRPRSLSSASVGG